MSAGGLRLIVAGGGTGGHLYPGLAVADEIKRRGGDVLFVGTERGIEARAVPAAGYPLQLLDVSGLKRMGFAGTLRGLGRLPRALLAARAIIQKHRPDVVMGVGGYASGPMGLAAAWARVPLVLQEQNSVPGVTNRALGKLARAVFIAFDDAEPFFPRGRCRMTGNPVRRAFLDAVDARPGDQATTADARPVRAARPGEQAADAPVVLAVGGSQGARAVNDLVFGAFETLAHAGAFTLVHQTGAADVDRMRTRYAASSFSTRVTVKPFIDDMVSAYRAADLVIGRAGALTLAELAVVGRPAVLIPLPTAADDHQNKNAASFARAGAACVALQNDTTPATLAGLISDLLAHRERLAAMARAMKALAKPDAASTVADALTELVGARSR